MKVRSLQLYQAPPDQVLGICYLMLTLFIQKENLRVPDHSASNRDALLLSSRELRSSSPAVSYPSGNDR